MKFFTRRFFGIFCARAIRPFPPSFPVHPGRSLRVVLLAEFAFKSCPPDRPQRAADDLEAALAPTLDIEGALRFPALENVMVNNDGYWIRTSDYNLYLAPKGRFHILPHDSNETFYLPGGPGFGGGRGEGGIKEFADQRRAYLLKVTSPAKP